MKLEFFSDEKTSHYTIRLNQQMCWFIKVTSEIVRNLLKRLFGQFLYTIYSMCLVCWCSKKDTNSTENTREQELNPSSEDFYKNVSREKAERLLANCQDGTFIVRPSASSNQSNNIGALSLIQDSKVFHLNIRRRSEDDRIALGSEKNNEKTFRDLDNLINYYISNYLVLFSDEQETLTLLLPYREKIISV